VVIPGLGGFVANTRSSFLNPAQHTFSPPTKRIAFNASLKSNDGLLAHYISNELDIPFSEALQNINSYVEDVFSSLNSGGDFRIENIGLISFDLEQHIQFEPDSTVNYLTESYGLSTIHSPAIRRDEPVGVLRSIKSPKKSKEGNKQSLWRLLELIPAAAILVFLAFSPGFIQNMNSNLGSIIPFGYSTVNTTKAENKSISNISEVPAIAESKSDALPTTTEINSQVSKVDSNSLLASVSENVSSEVINSSQEIADAIENVVPISTKVVTTSKAESEQKTIKENFYVIGGCFKIYDNAVKFQHDAFERGFDAVIIGTNDQGLHMVSLFSSHNSATTIKELAQIKVEIQQDAWVYSNSN